MGQKSTGSGQCCSCLLFGILLKQGAPVQLDPIVALKAVVVDPLTQRPIARHQQGQDGAAGGFHGILFERGVEPADSNGACQRVNLQSPDGLAGVAIDGESHGVV